MPCDGMLKTPGVVSNSSPTVPGVLTDLALTLGIDSFVGTFQCWPKRRENNLDMASILKPSWGSRMYTHC